MKIAIGSDHRGYDHKATIGEALAAAGHEIFDMGCDSRDSADYPDHAFAVLINQLEEQRWQQVRPPNKKERKATALMKLDIKEGSFVFKLQFLGLIIHNVGEFLI